MIKKFSWILLFLVLVTGRAYAQLPPPPGMQMPPDSISKGIMPAIAYNSDFGLIVGAIVNRYDYRGGKPPFRTFSVSNVLLSTEGLLNVSLFLDQVESFNTDIRSTYELYLARNLAAFYFGIGNNVPLDEQAWTGSDQYFFRSFATGFRYFGRKPLWFGENITRFDFTFSADIMYESPWGNEMDRQIMMDLPRGVEGGMSNGLGAGLSWENRDHEFRPTRGNTASVHVRYAPSFFRSDFQMGYLQSQVSQFFSFHFLLDVVVANRVAFEYAWGDVPYWRRPLVGGEQTLRGFPVNRFLGDAALYHNLELRTWLWESRDQFLRIGGQLFMDTGRVFYDGENLGDLTDRLHQSFGLGGALSMFTPDFFIRGDLGFSDEMRRLYISVGYAF
jgi:hypothetical protein